MCRSGCNVSELVAHGEEHLVTVEVHLLGGEIVVLHGVSFKVVEGVEVSALALILIGDVSVEVFASAAKSECDALRVAEVQIVRVGACVVVGTGREEVKERALFEG